MSLKFDVRSASILVKPTTASKLENKIPLLKTFCALNFQVKHPTDQPELAYTNMPKKRSGNTGDNVLIKFAA